MGSIWRLKECVRCGCEFEIDYEGIHCPSCVDADYNEKEWADEHNREFAQALTDETEDTEC